MSADQTASDAPLSVLQRFQSFRKSTLGRILLAVITLVVVVLAGYFVISKLISSIQQLSAAQTHISYIPVLLSLLITFICVILGGATWYLTLRGIGCPLKIGSCTKIHLLANLAGYLPGYGWKHLGKAILTSRQNVPVQLA
ncbi:MAG: hypothetical protein ACYC6L_14260, partial [Anaerolineae bacterium]